MRGFKDGNGLLRAAICVLIVGSMSLHAHTATADTITIDSFNYPNDPAGTTFYVPGEAPWGDGNPFVHQDPPNPGDPDTPEILGGQRDVLIEVVGDPLPISAAGIIGWEPVYGNGLLHVATSGEPGTLIVAQYDGKDLDPANALVDAMGLQYIDLTVEGNNAFKLSFNSVDAGDGPMLHGSITVTGPEGTETVPFEVAENPDPSEKLVPFSSFTTPDLLGSIESVTFGFNDGPGGPISNVDIELDALEVVPEPSTIAMLGALVASLGLATLRRRRR